MFSACADPRNLISPSNSRGKQQIPSIASVLATTTTMGYSESPFMGCPMDKEFRRMGPPPDDSGIIGLVIDGWLDLQKVCENANHGSSHHQCQGRKDWVILIGFRSIRNDDRQVRVIRPWALKDAKSLLPFMLCLDIKKKWLRGAWIRKHPDHLYEVVK